MEKQKADPRELVSCDCGHEVARENTTQVDELTRCNFCMQQDYIKKKASPFAAVICLPFLAGWLALPGALFVWVWEGWALGWRVFLTGLFTVVSLGVIYYFISEMVKDEAKKKYPYKLAGLTFKERIEQLNRERNG